jgi:hypothetical protein
VRNSLARFPVLVLSSRQALSLHQARKSRLALVNLGRVTGTAERVHQQVRVSAFPRPMELVHASFRSDGLRMTDSKDESRPSGQAADDMVIHKSTRECPMIQPHPRASCGIVRAREANRERMDEERRRAGRQPGG